MEPTTDELLNWSRLLGDWGFRLVIFGVAVEVAAAIVDFISEERFFDWHSKHKAKLRVLEFIGGGILIVGLAMEYRGHNKETEILDSRSAALNKEASQARKETAALEQTNLVLTLEAKQLAEQMLAMRQNVAPLTADEVIQFQTKMDLGMNIHLRLPAGARGEAKKIHAELLRIFTDSPWNLTNDFPNADLNAPKYAPKYHLMMVSKRDFEMSHDAAFVHVLSPIFNRLMVFRQWTTNDALGPSDLVIIVRPIPPFQR